MESILLGTRKRTVPSKTCERRHNVDDIISDLKNFHPFTEEDEKSQSFLN